MDSLYSDYYFALKQVWVLHRENNFGKSPDIPSGFSESLCKHLFNLEDTNTRDNDARNTEGTIEIKATGTHEDWMLASKEVKSVFVRSRGGSKTNDFVSC